MDFRRIEMIFLIVFIGLNIFLGISFFQSQQVDLATDRTDTSQILSDISRDQIKLPKLSNKTPTGGYLASQKNNDLAQNQNQLRNQTLAFTENGGATTLHSLLRNAPTVKKGEEVKFLESWMQDTKHILFGNQYVYAKALSSGDKFVFAQRVDGGTVYDRRAQITFTLANERLLSYTQTYVAHMRTLRANVALTSERDAIVALYRDNEIGNNTAVLWTHLAYSYLLDAKGSTVYVPTWFVGVESQTSKNVTIKRLNAITKTVMKTASDEGSD